MQIPMCLKIIPNKNNKQKRFRHKITKWVEMPENATNQPTNQTNRNPKPLANQLWCINFLTPPTPLIIPHRLPTLLESLTLLLNWCSIHARWSKAVWSIPCLSAAFFLSLKQNFIAYLSSKVSSRPDCIFEIHQLWKSQYGVFQLLM